MAAKHFRNCERMPIETIRRIHQLIPQDIEESAEDSALKEFCKSRCSTNGIVNRYPHRSGLIVGEFSCASPSKEQNTSIQLNQSEALIQPLVCSSNPLIDSLLDDKPHHTTNKKPSTIQMRSTLGNNRNAVKMNDTIDPPIPSFFQDQNGLWRCQACVFAQYKGEVEFSTWEERNAPPLWFAKKHSQYCPQLQAQTFFGKLDTQHSDFSHKGNKICEAHRDCEQALEKMKSNDNKINSNSHHDGRTKTLYPLDHPQGRQTMLCIRQLDKNVEKSNEPSFHNSYTSSHVEYTPSIRKGHNNATAHTYNAQKNVQEFGNHDDQFRPHSTTSVNSTNTGKSQSMLSSQSHGNQSTLFAEALTTINDTADVLETNQDYSQKAFSDLVFPEDKAKLSDYTFEVVRYMKRCLYSKETDGKGTNALVTRNQFPEGYPGIQCVFCAGMKTSRKFFFSKCERLSNNLSEIGGHLMKCKYCPRATKTKLQGLKEIRQHQQKNLPRGAQKEFFQKYWARLHGEQLSPPNDSIPLPHHDETTLACTDDKKYLSDVEFLLRKNIEVFCVTEEDESCWKSSKPELEINVGQVGLRCIHCVETNKIELDAKLFPSSIRGIRDCVRMFQENHFPQCNCIQQDLKRELIKVKMPGLCDKSINEYYTDSAKRMGLYDSQYGISLRQKKTEKDSFPLVSVPAPAPAPYTFSSLGNKQSATDSMRSNLSSFDEILPKPPLEMYLEDDHTRADTVHNEDTLFQQNHSGSDNISSPSSPNAVTPCATTGAKRKYSNISHESLVNSEGTDNPKKGCSL